MISFAYGSVGLAINVKKIIYRFRREYDVVYDQMANRSILKFFISSAMV